MSGDISAVQQPRILLEERFELGECPNWDGYNNRLYWADIIGQKIHALDIETGQRHSWSFESEVGCFGLTDQGRLVVALKSDIILFDPKTGVREKLAAVDGDNDMSRTNDGKIGPDGAFWVGTMDQNADKQPVASLYRVTGSGEVEHKVGGIKISNGLAWSPDGRIMYHSDSRGPWVNRWDFDAKTGAIRNCQRFLDLNDTVGRPDGAAVDMEGCYWSAGVSAGKLNRFAPDGTLLLSIDMPMPNPTMPCFGGLDMKTLYVTSHMENYPADKRAEFPDAGKLVMLRVDVAGVPVNRFREDV
ncbi:Sugar lactone lactonase YvrE [Thalassospira xiamenensis M-5 = DSM 17429]|uniref:SMP-30/gluconolaconase/LRE-like region superfamily protein n=1 Tax=Thalassospira xiamenensis M-5 = DSM 17429 TaxID=1123366 RepID=A0AB72UFF1_9PROT|nr:SMP-30/gluconolactonase/LRE family protein [Thalassospira xiamenensis]AJD52837.1 SMP-30/gluconolaconase/LRE-like region superfamily protein [Thalassospira xiamenensis M-5 = DSM 17429]SIT31139.1 Sugar lactone lactonase YvrE [Thalassospira xiamenensis M-5 = DSM 17429]